MQKSFPRTLSEPFRNLRKTKLNRGKWSVTSALELARQGYKELLPEGLATPGHFLFTVHDATNNANVGVLWYAVEERAVSTCCLCIRLPDQRAISAHGLCHASF